MFKLNFSTPTHSFLVKCRHFNTTIHVINLQLVLSGEEQDSLSSYVQWYRRLKIRNRAPMLVNLNDTGHLPRNMEISPDGLRLTIRQLREYDMAGNGLKAWLHGWAQMTKSRSFINFIIEPLPTGKSLCLCLLIILKLCKFSTAVAFLNFSTLPTTSVYRILVKFDTKMDFQTHSFPKMYTLMIHVTVKDQKLQWSTKDTVSFSVKLH